MDLNIIQQGTGRQKMFGVYVLQCDCVGKQKQRRQLASPHNNNAMRAAAMPGMCVYVVRTTRDDAMPLRDSHGPIVPPPFAISCFGASQGHQRDDDESTPHMHTSTFSRLAKI